MHEQFLRIALAEAMLGRGMCAPNPSVGAVAVRDGCVIAQARHHGAGTPHAEQLLLAEVPEDSSDITLYITLEPCNHWGRTPPCADVIIKRKVSRVVYAYKDPNPIVSSNKTPELLRAHGIDVIYHPMPEIDDFYQSYHYWTQTKRPWVTVKIAQTFDGMIASGSKERTLLTNGLCQEFTHLQRLRSDVILTTARTVQLDNPLLNVRLTDMSVAKPVAIIDKNRTLCQSANVFSSAKYCHIYHDEAHVAEDSTYCHGVPVTNGLLNLDAVISHLGRFGYHDVWVEAGGALFSALHLQGLVNRTYIYLVPKTLGAEGISAYRHKDVLSKASNVRWQALEDNMIVTLDW